MLLRGKNAVTPLADAGAERRQRVRRRARPIQRADSRRADHGGQGNNNLTEVTAGIRHSF